MTDTIKCDGKFTTTRNPYTGDAVQIEPATENDERKCNAPATFRVRYLDGSTLHACDTCVSPATVIHLIKGAVRI